MSQNHRDLMLLCAAYDRTFRYSGGRHGTWLGKCIHCRRKLGLEADGKPHGGTTLEHIVPRTHGGTNAPENLAIACGRCNAQKGRKLDVLPVHDHRLVSVIQTLRERRANRLRPLADHGCPRLGVVLQRFTDMGGDGPG